VQLREFVNMLAYTMRGKNVIPVDRQYKALWSALIGTAGALAAMALYNLYRSRKAEGAHPPAGRFVTVDGVRLHYIEKGNGPPVILLHGNIVSSADFALSGTLDRIARRHRVIAFDRPGFGYSEVPRDSTWNTPRKQADVLRRAFTALDIDGAVVLGHSFGAIVALELALRHPEVVSGLVLVSGYYYPTLRADVLPVVPAAIPIIGALIRYTVLPPLSAALLPAKRYVRASRCSPSLCHGLSK
jgi:pimeloyl-ACP methyl ester carboxylesterase